MPEYPAPVSCKLHEDELRDIKVTVKEINGKLDKWFGPDGAVWNINTRLTSVEHSEMRLHERVDNIEGTVKDESTKMNALAVKVGGIASVPGLIAAVIMISYWVTK